ncbi:MAG: discoidin domain-containing protein [bacterium]|nr:discoidin domain-containing protein [bacterium]
MKRTLVSLVRQVPRQGLYAALFGILVVLLLLLAVNDKNWKPLKEKLWWNVTANYSKNGALLAVDHNLKTRWSSYAPMTSGMFFQVDVGKTVTMNGVLLQVDRKERRGQPISWRLKGSLDGKEWQTLGERPALTHKGMLVIPFKAVRARYIQIIQTSINSTPIPWMIYEIGILQPVVPWQFSRATLLNAIVGWLVLILAVALFGGRKESTALTFGTIAILLLGWVLRSYGLSAHEFSEHEFRFFQRLAFGRYTLGEWLRAYWGLFDSGAYWLYFLLVRFAHQFWQTPQAAFRVVSGIFSLGAVTAAFFVWKNFLHDKEALWVAGLFSALLSVSGWQVYLSRSGDFSGSFLFVFLMYLLLTYTFLYKRVSFWLAIGLVVLLCLGIFLHPVMGLVPVGLLCFGVWHLWLCKYAPTFFPARHVQSFHFRHQMPRTLLYLLSVLPGLAYWLVFFSASFFYEQLSMEGLGLYFRDEFGQMLQRVGIAGVVVWLFWGLVLLGVLSFVREREHGEWFFAAQVGMLLLLLTPFLLDDQYVSAFSVLLLLLLFLFVVRGLLESIAFLCVRQPAKMALRIRLMLIVAVLGYTLFFSVSSLFFISAPVEGETDRFAAYHESMKLGPLLRQVTSDPVACRRSVMLDTQLATMYEMEYGLEGDVRSLADLLRFAKQGIFYAYAFVGFRDIEAYPDREQFFTHYYTEAGRSAQVVLYRLREEFSALPQRYFARNLFSATGRAFRDVSIPRRLVRTATPGDAPGLMVFGPFIRLCEAGDYIARFRVRLMEWTDMPVATLKVMADRHELFGVRELSGDDFPDTEKYYSFKMPFHLDFSNNPAHRMKRLELLVDFHGEAEVRVDSVELIPRKRKRIN